MSPNTTPMAPSTSGAMRCPGPAVAVAVVTNVGDAACVKPGALRRRRVLAPSREADVELLQLPVEVGPLEARLFGDLAHVALLATQQLLEVDPLERLARLAQRQVEEA